MGKSEIPSVRLMEGQQMPVMAMGTASITAEEETKAAIVEGMKAGFRHFDTAYSYGTEKALGEAIREGVELGIVKSREELFITSKLSPAFAHPSLVLNAIQATLEKLKMEYVDMYLIHIPLKLKRVGRGEVGKDDISAMDVKGVWEMMEHCKILGLTKAIGVSNFSVPTLTHLLSFAKIPPALNQVEISAVWHQKKLREFCKAKGIHVTAYSPLGAAGTSWGHNKIVESRVLSQIAEAKGKTTAQVALRWVYEQEVSIVTKSSNKERMRQNIDIFDWSLSKEELANISQLPQHRAIVFANIFGHHDLVLHLDAQLNDSQQ
ncbi:D-galacturonate reductase-like [Benincasa hispida]|uniref:D-galacturonate reductase-like n=1 Tax=Benincasa hispida TaxID=102211 RepID=UPI00190229A7|nr:D-galacturonate reductase-like [Benincasa hispida]